MRSARARPQRLRVSWAVLLVAAMSAGSVAATGSVAAAASEPALDGRIVLSVGHVDAIEPHLVDGELVVLVKDDTEPGSVRRHHPDEVLLHVRDLARRSIAPGYEFLAGDQDATEVWLLPLAQHPELLWPGWSTEHPSLRGEVDGRLDITVKRVDGPGAFSLFTQRGFEEIDVYASTSTRAPARGLPSTWHEPVGAHVHANWAFTAPGSYDVVVEVGGTLRDGRRVSSGEVTYRFHVGDQLPDPGEPPIPDGAALVVATLSPSEGALILSVDPSHREVRLPPLALAPSGDRFETIGALNEVVVTDTRVDDPGWTATAQASDFVADAGGGSFGGDALGWIPEVAGTTMGQQVSPGPAIAPALGDGPGLGAGALLASASAGAGRGTARLAAELHLWVPTDTPPGIHRSIVTFTVM